MGRLLMGRRGVDDFSSDNYSPVPQQVLDALVEANKGYQPSYGEDSQMTKVRHLIQKYLRLLKQQFI